MMPRPSTVRLVCGVVAALICGAFVYPKLMWGELPWWRIVGPLVTGWGLLIVAFGTEASPAEPAVRRWGRRALGAVAPVSAGIGIWLGQQPGQELPAGIAYAAAVTAFLLARWVPFSPDSVYALIGDPAASATRPDLNIVRVVALAATLGTAGAAVVMNDTNHLAAFLLWLSSLALFAAAVFQRGRSVESLSSEAWQHAGGPPLSRRGEVVAFALVMLLAAALRLPLLAEVPGGINPDEGRQGRSAERMWTDGFPDVFDFGWNLFPNLSSTVHYVGVQVNGTSNQSLRLSAAAIGLLSLVPVFFWVRRWWGNVVALLALLLLAINREHLGWSRAGFNNIDTVLVAGLILAALARGLRTQRWVDWVWCGYAAGLGFHTYHSAKLYPALLIGIAVLLAIGIPSFVRRYFSGAVVACVAFLLCLGPQLVRTYQRWDLVYMSTSDRLDLHVLLEAYQRGDTPAVRDYLWHHVYGCLMCFFSVPSPQEAIFDPFVAVPFLLGVGWMLWRWRDPRHLVVLAWGLGILALAGMITSLAPWKPRMLGFLPVVCLIPAVVVGRIRAELTRIMPASADLIVLPVVFVWLTAALYQNWYTIFEYWPPLHRNMMTEIARLLERTPLPATIYMMGSAETFDPKISAQDCMVASNKYRVLINPANDPSIIPFPPTHAGNAVLLVSETQTELLPLVRHYYSLVREDIVRDYFGRLMYYAFTLPPDQIERSRGLHASFRSPSRVWSDAVGVDKFTVPNDAELPVQAVWRGQVFLSAPGACAFRSTGASLSLDGAPTRNEESRLFAAGWHGIEVRATFKNAVDGISVEWLPPDATEWSPIPRAALHTHVQRHGLLGRYFDHAIASTSPTPIVETPQYTHIDSALSFDLNMELENLAPAPFAARPSTMEWVGSVKIPEGSEQRLRLETTGPAQVFINGQLVLSAAGLPSGEKVEADVVSPGASHGRVPILVRTVRPADSGWTFWKFRLLFRDAGGGWTAFVRYRPEGRAELVAIH